MGAELTRISVSQILYGETTVEPPTKIIRFGSRADFGVMQLDSTLARSCTEATIHASTKQQLLRLNLNSDSNVKARRRRFDFSSLLQRDYHPVPYEGNGWWVQAK
ncbi:hypothetical protein QAD02_010987 [Eretmocerus hayati]|uniref:Uncharacterized protein n=1 Tax=Eretmocerus hayati TaxID=131215 RepID=A0ACC2NVM6_9HYME|nr:hypothetical protein QAD02_010987 [Eretmocerus hayati]